MRKLTIVLLALALAAPVLAASPTITKLDDVNFGRDGVCTVGNPYADNFAGGYDDFWFGGEEYAVLVSPLSDGCAACGAGFVLNQISMIMGLPTDAELQVQGALYEAVDSGGGVYVPGTELYVTDIYTLNGIAEEGYYFVDLPAASPCATVGDKYFISFRFLDDGASYVGIAVDTSPTSGYGYNEGGFGWLDLVDYFGLVGDVFVYADIDCCAAPVATETSSWGSVKTLFR